VQKPPATTAAQGTPSSIDDTVSSDATSIEQKLSGFFVDPDTERGVKSPSNRRRRIQELSERKETP
jgi:hypothetical protein